MSLPHVSKKTLALQSGRKGRKDHIATIRALKRNGGDAVTYWLRECPRLISLKSFNAA